MAGQEGYFQLICPYCGVPRDKVIDSRSSEGGLVVRRRRQCASCKRRFTTYERVERTARLMVVKRNGARVAFDTEAVLQGIQAACGKRPVPEDKKMLIVSDLEEELHREFDREVPSVEIGRRVAAKLRAVDAISYIRFASEYYGFKTLEEFAKEIAALQSRPHELPNQQDLFSDGV